MYQKMTNFEKNQPDKTMQLLERKTKEVDIIQQVSTEINKTLDLAVIGKSMLLAMDEYFGFQHSMILLMDNENQSLSVLSTHGYDDGGSAPKLPLEWV